MNKIFKICENNKISVFFDRGLNFFNNFAYRSGESLSILYFDVGKFVSLKDFLCYQRRYKYGRCSFFFEKDTKIVYLFSLYFGLFISFNNLGDFLDFRRRRNKLKEKKRLRLKTVAESEI